MAATKLNMTPDEAQEMARDIREIKQAVIGDKSIGLNGLVSDMHEMKSWRDGITAKVIFVSGVVAGGVVGVKALMEKLL